MASRFWLAAYIDDCLILTIGSFSILAREMLHNARQSDNN